MKYKDNIIDLLHINCDIVNITGVDIYLQDVYGKILIIEAVDNISYIKDNISPIIINDRVFLQDIKLQDFIFNAHEIFASEKMYIVPEHIAIFMRDSPINKNNIIFPDHDTSYYHHKYGTVYRGFKRIIKK